MNALCATAAPPRPEPLPAPPAASPTTELIYNLAGSSPFCPVNPSVIASFGSGHLHECKAHGSWDIERAAADAPHLLVRSVRKFRVTDKEEHRWDDLTFRHGPRAFLYADAESVYGFADALGEARRLVTEFTARYAKPPPTNSGGFYLIRTGGGEIKTKWVPLQAETLLDSDTLRLHYGGAGLAWHEEFAARLRATRRGLCVLEGSPGTGKTSYLRHLMGVLRESHRFYFIPPATLDVLSDSGFIGFWAEQRAEHEEQQFVVVLEDADAALMTRENDNRSQVSALLNLSDGMMGDFLRLQIICTINCRAGDLDPALLRPGRLLCHRVFERMDAAHARRLASHLGRQLPAVERDFSLAEVYAGGKPETVARPARMGFGA